MSDIKLEEYKFLIQEHQKNRSYIFERPLLIFGTIAISFQFTDKAGISTLVLSFMLFIACFNLWFTSHRYSSSARIIAYLRLFHEGELKDMWVGWETSLSKYRTWINLHKEEYKKIKKNINKDASSDKLQFYGGIWLFHLFLVLFIYILLLYKSEEIIYWSLFVLTAIVVGIMFTVLRPEKLRHNIEVEIEVWQRVFK